MKNSPYLDQKPRSLDEVLEKRKSRNRAIHPLFAMSYLRGRTNFLALGSVVLATLIAFAYFSLLKPPSSEESITAEEIHQLNEIAPAAGGEETDPTVQP